VADPAHVKRFDRALQVLTDLPGPPRRLDAIRHSLTQLEAQEPMFQDTGDFTIKMKGSNTEWKIKDVTFEHADKEGAGRCWMLARPMTEQERQEARDRGALVSDPLGR
jgi:hypothetical protein